MEFNYDLLNNYASQVDIKSLNDSSKDLLWCVTRVRAKAYRILDTMGLCYAEGDIREFDAIKDDFIIMWQNLLVVLAQFPEEVKYAEDKVETPRKDAIQTILDTFNGLTSDEDVVGSMRELTRIVGTNEDSSHDKLNYAILMGIVNRIIAWAYPDKPLNDYIKQSII